MTYDLFAWGASPSPADPTEYPDEYSRRLPSPPSILWGICWRSAVVEAGAVCLLNGGIRVPAHLLLWTLAALLAGALPVVHLWRRAGPVGAFWRATSAAVGLALSAGTGLLLPALAWSGAVCLLEPPAQRLRRWRR